MLSLLPIALGLGPAALAALALTWSRWSPPERRAERRAAARVLALALGVQSVHFAEEAMTGFHDRLGALVGLPGMPFPFFVLFNVMWLGIWVASVPGVRSARGLAFFAAWFLAIAGAFNGIAHPLLALASGAYFPGLVTSPVIGAVSVWLFLRLRGATAARYLPGRTRAPVRTGEGDRCN
jgi:hypothetical protein